MATLISWADETWNPVTGCTSASAGCDHCYARALINKWFGANVKVAIELGFTKPRDGLTVVELARQAGARLPYPALQAARPFSSVQCWPQRLRQPYGWKKPSRVFVNSLSDVFHPDVPEAFRDAMYDVMEATPQHVYQVLTKRPDIMARYTQKRYSLRSPDLLTVAGMGPEHIWHGTSIEDGRVLDRLDHLANVLSPVKFISGEPLIGALTDRFRDWPTDGWPHVEKLAEYFRLSGVSWVIVGGESGPGYRPMPMAWAREARDAAVMAGAAFFFKQDAAFRTETRCYLVEEDGSKWEWHQFPGHLDAPKRVA